MLLNQKVTSVACDRSIKSKSTGDSVSNSSILTCAQQENSSEAFINSHSSWVFPIQPNFIVRYYDGELGRFVGRDPLGYVDGMSLYRGYFVVNGVDPSGMTPSLPCSETENPGSPTTETDTELGSCWRKCPCDWLPHMVSCTRTNTITYKCKKSNSSWNPLKENWVWGWVKQSTSYGTWVKPSC
jgi:hypothetical protein